jgi:hypothetical protein
MERTENEMLEHAVVNQLEVDFNDLDFDAMSEMLKNLIHLEPARKVLTEYLSDTAKENLIEGRTNCRY